MAAVEQELAALLKLAAATKAQQNRPATVAVKNAGIYPDIRLRRKKEDESC